MARRDWMARAVSFFLVMGCASSEPIPEAAGGGVASPVAPTPARMPVATGPRAPRIYTDVPIAEALRKIAAEGGVDIDYHDPGNEVRVTYHGDDSLSWETLLEGVVESGGLRLRKKSDRLYTVRPAARISVQFQDESIHDALVLIASMSGMSIIVGEGVEGTITLSLEHVPAREAIEAIAKTGGYVVVRTDTGWAVNSPR